MTHRLRARRARSLALAGVAAPATALLTVLAPLPAAAATGPTELVVSVRDDPDSAARSYTLQCDPAGGSHPDASAACRALASVADPFAPVAADAVCTQVHGGPATARVTGRYRGGAVDATFSRVDGCQIERWNRITPVFPGAADRGGDPGTPACQTGPARDASAAPSDTTRCDTAGSAPAPDPQRTATPARERARGVWTTRWKSKPRPALHR